MHKQFRPTISGIWVALFYMNVFLLIVFSVNLLLGSNYFWIMEKPPTSSLLDYLGPWPWYIFFAEFIALFHFAIAYTPVLMERYFKEKRQNLRILSFADFYPYYISQHKIPLNRLCHNIGSVLSISVFVVSIYKNMFFIMFLSPLLGYAFAWYGHFAIEKNKPATFKFPIYSFLGDWLMLWDNIRGVDFNEIIYKFKRNEKK